MMQAAAGTVQSEALGISGFAVYLPPYRVCLAEWCRWTGASAEKIEQVVGASFRMCDVRENVYTMAASAVLRLIHQHDIDPADVGMLALGTESSTDNSAGAVIIRGMIDEALRARGAPPLSRHCEVPELKHACLGGVYALKSALRYLAVDGGRRQAIVVSADIAEYARGSSGEPTQGAGAVAMLLERDPKMLAVDLTWAGSASEYRGADFRKPFSRFLHQQDERRLKDFPVFNGKYSTTCYIDEILMAMEEALGRRRALEADGGEPPSGLALLARQRAVFMHRPYQRMPETGWSMIVLYTLATGNAGDHELLGELCALAGSDLAAVRRELTRRPDIYELFRRGLLDEEVYPLALEVIRGLRKSALYAEHVRDKLSLGVEVMRQVGNLYCGALPAWIAAGLEEAAAQRLELGGGEILAIGYGSGDAAEVIPMRVAPEWRDAARLTRFDAALAHPVDLTQTEYESLHDRGVLEREANGDAGAVLAESPFAIERIGSGGAAFDDRGIEYYRYLSDGDPASPAQ